MSDLRIDWSKVEDLAEAAVLADHAVISGFDYGCGFRAGYVASLEFAAGIADELAEGVANPEKPYNEAFIHACGVVARHIREAK